MAGLERGFFKSKENTLTEEVAVITVNLQKIRAAIEKSAQKAGRQAQDVMVVAVTKTVSPERIAAAVKAGVLDFGENRVQEVLPKIDLLPAEIRWHFIGHLQTNKIKYVTPRFHLIHSLDRIKLARALNKWGEKEEKKVYALVQLNIAGEKSKHGLDPRELNDFLEEISAYSSLKVQGLMTMAPYVSNPEEIRPVFQQLYRLFSCTNIPGIEMKYLSMGMSNDFKIAVEEGANMVRIGSAIFREEISS